jgi:hypothetical protein
MEQLVNAVTPYYYAMAAFLFFGFGIIGFSIIIFIISNMTTKKELLIMLNLGGILIIPGLYFSNICDKYNEQTIAIVKPVISENYPDATDFSYSIDEGSFTENNIEYKIQYKKTVNNEEKLIITVKDEQSKDKNTKMLDIPKTT